MSRSHARVSLRELLVCSDLIASVTHAHVGTLVTTTDLSDCIVHPLVLVQVVNEVPLVILTSDDTLLCCSHTSTDHLSTLGSLWGPVTTHEALRMLIDRLARGVLSMKEKGLETERLALKPSILDVVVGWRVVHELLHTSLTLVTVQDLLHCLSLSDHLLGVGVDMAIQEMRR